MDACICILLAQVSLTKIVQSCCVQTIKVIAVVGGDAQRYWKIKYCKLHQQLELLKLINLEPEQSHSWWSDSLAIIPSIDPSGMADCVIA